MLKDISNRVTKNGKPLDPGLYTWDHENKAFYSGKGDLVLGFEGIDGCTFYTGNDCTFDTGNDCTFDTGNDCTFDTGNNCTFDTGNDCTFDTTHDCTFDTGRNCNFNTYWGDCTFKVQEGCVIIGRTFKNNNVTIIHPIPNQKLIIGIDYNVYVTIIHPIPNQKLFIDPNYNVIYDNPITDIKYKKDLKNKDV